MRRTEIPFVGHTARDTDAVENSGWHGKQYIPNLWTGYRLTTDSFNRLWNDQAGLCEGCKRQLAHPFEDRLPPGLRCEVDHDPETKRGTDEVKVRGLLCRKCNQLLGKLHDNEQTFHGLAVYLRKHGKTVTI